MSHVSDDCLMWLYVFHTHRLCLLLVFCISTKFSCSVLSMACTLLWRERSGGRTTERADGQAGWDSDGMRKISLRTKFE